MHLIYSFSKHVSLCTQPCAEQSWGPKSDTVSVLTEFLIWKEDKYELLECKVMGALVGAAKGSVKVKAQREHPGDGVTEKSNAGSEI